MSSKFISVQEINSILSAIEDKSGIELLEQVRDNTVNESDIPKHKAGKQLNQEEQQKDNQERSFIGFTKEEDVAKDDDVKKGVLNRLVDNGLLTKGGYIPLEGERINSYRLTNEGFALLYLVERIRGVVNKSQNNTQEEQRETRKAEREEQRESKSRRD